MLHAFVFTRLLIAGLIIVERNNQLPEKVISNDDGVFEVISIFPTIQGEGPYAGCPAVFVRLAGCTLQCPLCDTQYTQPRLRMTIHNILNVASRRLVNMSADVLVITGGEPFRQNVTALANAAIDHRWQVQIETNGTLPISSDLSPDVVVVCAPKTEKIHETVRKRADAMKYVIESGHVCDRDGLPTRCLGYDHRVARPVGFGKNKIYVQPLDEYDPIKNEEHTKAAVDVCRRFGYRLCLQMHKIVGLA